MTSSQKIYLTGMHIPVLLAMYWICWHSLWMWKINTSRWERKVKPKHSPNNIMQRCVLVIHFRCQQWQPDNKTFHPHFFEQGGAYFRIPSAPTPGQVDLDIICCCWEKYTSSESKPTSAASVFYHSIQCGLYSLGPVLTGRTHVTQSRQPVSILILSLSGRYWNVPPTRLLS